MRSKSNLPIKLIIVALALFVCSDVRAMKVLASTSGSAGVGVLIGAPLGPLGMAAGAAIGGWLGAEAGTKAVQADAIKEAAEKKRQQEQERREYAEQQKREQEEKEKYVHRDRFLTAMFAPGEYEKFEVSLAQRGAFEAFERGERLITIGRRAYFDNVAVKVSAIEERIKQKMLTLRQINARPVGGYTGNFVELNARYAVANQDAINNPMAERLRMTKAQFEDPQLNQLFQDIQELFIVGNLFNRTSNKPIEILKDVAANIRWATANAYAHPLMQELDQTRLDLQELRDLLAERNRVLEESTRLAEQRGQRIDQLNEEKAGIIAAARRRSGEYRAQLLEKEAENARQAREIEGVEEVLPRIAQNTRNLEEQNAQMREEIERRRRRSLELRGQIATKETEKERIAKEKEELAQEKARKEEENARMREEIAQRRRRSIEYKELIAAKEAENKRLAEEKEKVKKDLASARDAFASCTLTNRPNNP